MTLRSTLFGSGWRSAATLLVVAAMAGGAWFAVRPRPDPDARWRTVTLERGALSQRIVATGTLQPIGQVSVGTQVSGTIARVQVDFNQAVRRGQVLAEIDPSLLRSTLKQAEAGLKNAQAQLDLARDAEGRSRALLERAFIARPQLDSAIQTREAAQASLEVARAQVERAQTDLANAVIRSPIDGVVIARKIDVGQTVAASFQTPDMFVIARDLREMEIHANVSEADVGAVREAMPVEFRVDAFVDRKFTGTVRQIRLNAKTEQGVVTYDVVITADNGARLLLPGMTARVEIVAANKDGVLKIPNAALRFRPAADTDKGGKAGAANGNMAGGDAGKGVSAPRSAIDAAAESVLRVYRLKDSKAERVDVRVGISDGRFTELVEGALNAGDRLIVRDMQGKQAGDISIGF